MHRSTSTIRVGAGLALVAAVLLGLGIGTSLATAGALPDQKKAGLPEAVDLTRHTTTLVDGVPGTRGSVSVGCPEGIVIGGGFSHVSSGLRVTGSRPDGIRAWQVSWAQTTTDDTALYAYAVCLTTA